MNTTQTPDQTSQIKPNKPPRPPGVVSKVSSLITKIDKMVLKISFFEKVPVVVRRIIIIGGVFYLGLMLFLLVIALLLAVLRSNGGGGRIEVSPPPKVTPAPAQERNPSVYATDSAVLQLEEDINTHDQSLKNTDITEPVLGVPSLNFDVNF